MRLIDADRHRFILNGWLCDLEEFRCDKEANAEARAIFDCICQLDEASTIEAEPVKHGRWLEVQEEQWNVEGLVTIGYECSKCGNSEGWNKMNYCPNCGAKMDLEG